MDVNRSAKEALEGAWGHGSLPAEVSRTPNGTATRLCVRDKPVLFWRGGGGILLDVMCNVIDQALHLTLHSFWVPGHG